MVSLNSIRTAFSSLFNKKPLGVDELKIKAGIPKDALHTGISTFKESDVERFYGKIPKEKIATIETKDVLTIFKKNTVPFPLFRDGKTIYEKNWTVETYDKNPKNKDSLQSVITKLFHVIFKKLF